MAVLLGVDTGGTYTDAVLIGEDQSVLASAKALTTRGDLAIGVGGAVREVLAAASVAPGDIAMASLSTTLATNALVEGQGGRAALVFIGFAKQDLDAHGLRDALRGDPVLICAGGHDHAGSETVALDEDALGAFVKAQGPHVSGFAVASRFATRNPAHEQRAVALIRERTGRPVSASHQLSAKLNGPKRALTALLNARLIGMIEGLIGRAETVLSEIGITAPMMVVRGDGALISAAQAREKPIETILSGPAASIVGARWLTGATDAMVSDIGGTTTDIALLRQGQPAIDPAGARVGSYRTMVEAVAMRTTGLGGDSEITLQSEGLQGGVFLGPRRVLPVSLAARIAPEVVHSSLDQQLRSAVPGEFDARFIRAVEGQNTEGLGSRETDLLERIGPEIQPLGSVIRMRIEHEVLRRLVGRGLVQLAGPTPSDASHVVGGLDAWDGSAAEKAMQLLARRRAGSGSVFAASAQDMAQMVIGQLTAQTGIALLEAGFAEEGGALAAEPEAMARHVLMQKGLRGHRNMVRLDTGLNLPVIGLGASAAAYYPAVGTLVGTEMVLPRHGDVANAIGAVVGRIRMRETGTVSAAGEGLFRVHDAGGPRDFTDQTAALAALEATLSARAVEKAQRAGAADTHTQVFQDVKTASVEGRSVFVEATVTVEATGRPGVASPAARQEASRVGG
ncbi:hydantoinase/oxoprolinase family protein [uncultured Roseobacter sp.]|uniref:hydantoinase/oxoprolinase family protein n=1 Tax=uncultured Roseobacter sp. TaxID=114847 RepID=UPI00260F2E95|nr:hydantoinase/oxoprolinase family protein [uncultured Roseobacter sp.]